MATMPIVPAHAKPIPRRDHAWVVAIIAGFCLYNVWGAWTQLGNESGFPHGSGWTLTVIVELYWGYALYAWLAASPGPLSRRFAKRSAIAVFACSLAGQGSSYLAVGRKPPVPVEVFVHVLPVIVLALAAFLVHFRQLDRAQALEKEDQAVREAAAAEQVVVAGEVDALQAELTEAREGLRAAETARDEAAFAAAAATAKAEAVDRMLVSVPNFTQPGDAKKPGTGVPRDIAKRAEALAIFAEEPDITGEELGTRVGMSKRWGQMRKNEFAPAVKADAAGPSERGRN